MEIFGAGKKPFVGEAKARDYLVERPGCSGVPWEPRGSFSAGCAGGQADIAAQPGPGWAGLGPRCGGPGGGRGPGGLWGGSPALGAWLSPPVITREEERQFVVKSIVRSQVK